MLVVLICGAAAHAQVDVFVDFTSDLHDGGGGSPNSIPDWIDELDQLTASVGVPVFTPVERTTIETLIMANLTTLYAGYDITFLTVPATPPHDSIDFGKDNFGFGSLGVAPTDPANILSGPTQTAHVAPANFGFILDETPPRPAQIVQLANALSGTGGHELGHSFGLHHHDAYSHPFIDPSTYASTGGVQNVHIMATDETGLIETEREVPRVLSAWSRAKLDITGGAVGKIGGEHYSLVTTPIPLDTTEEDSFDAPPSIAGAPSMTLTPGDTSGMLIGFISGNPDDTNGPPPPDITSDADTYKLSLGSAGRLTAEVFSAGRFGSFGYNTALELLGPGGAVIFAVDNVHYFDDVYNAGPLQQTDPLLMSIPIPGPGDYYLRVVPTVPGEVGPLDAYWLVAGFQPIPEPSTFGALLAVGAIALSRRHSKHRTRN